jgi:FtsH-binding integral membrane protein
MNPKARRTAPTKWWLLGLFTVGEAISVGFLSSLYHFRSVVMAMGATAMASITVSMYTIMQNNPDRDLSQWGASLSS